MSTSKGINAPKSFSSSCKFFGIALPSALSCWTLPVVVFMYKNFAMQSSTCRAKLCWSQVGQQDLAGIVSSSATGVHHAKGLPAIQMLAGSWPVSLTSTHRRDIAFHFCCHSAPGICIETSKLLLLLGLHCTAHQDLTEIAHTETMAC